MGISEDAVIGNSSLSIEEKAFVVSSLNDIQKKRCGIFAEGTTFGFTSVSDGTIMKCDLFSVNVSTAKYKLNDGTIFSPAEELLSALRKLKNGNAMTFYEEYMIESVYHESVHSLYRVEIPKLKKNTIEERILETCTQLYARVNYKKILNLYGVAADNYNIIQTSGLGYKNACLAIREYFMKDGQMDIGELLQYAKGNNSIYTFIKKLDGMGIDKTTKQKIFKNLNGQNHDYK